MKTINILPNKSDLYRLPFTKNDNPNGWVEITTDCNLRCPGCYRGCDRDENIPVHESLENVKEIILKMKHLRNCQIISLSGGEPLLHPELGKIIHFIKENGMSPFVHTNGLKLTKDLIENLKKEGLEGLIIRVDSLSRNRVTTEDKLNNVRQRFGELVNSVGGIHLTFLCVVNQDNINELGSVIKWAVSNSKLFDFLTFIPMRQVRFDENDDVDDAKWIYIDDLCSEIKKTVPEIKYASYLGSKLDDTRFTWLQSPVIVMNKKILGFTGPKFVEVFQMFHHLFKGKYAYKFGKGRSYMNFITILLISIFLSDFRMITLNYIKEIIKNPVNLFKRATVLLLCYIVPPDFVNGVRDECDGCPDAMLLDGRLVPSCGLEEFKLNGKPFESHLVKML